MTSAIRFGLWVRSTPNVDALRGSRYKPIAFRELGIAVDLPRALTTLVTAGAANTTVSLRIVHTYIIISICSGQNIFLFYMLVYIVIRKC